MNWRTRIDPELIGSYRGQTFHVERHDAKVGRRWLIHEYPRRDKPYSEDMGRRAKEWRLQFFVAGDDYDRQRDALVEAFDEPGAAQLVHPYLGTFMAVASDVTFSESVTDGGVCTFQVTFSEAGVESYPATTMDTQREVGLAADLFEGSVLDDFAQNFSVDGLLGFSLDSVLHDVTAVVRGIESVVGGIADQIASVIRFPANLAGIVLGGFNRLKGAVMRPINALDLYSGANLLGRSGDDSSGRVLLSPGTPVRAVRLLRETAASSNSVIPPAADTPERRQRAQNTLAARALNGRLATLTAVRVVAETDWASRQEAMQAGQDALDMIDEQMSVAQISDTVYGALVALRAAVTEDLRTRAVALPGLTTYTPQTTLPAVVVAHRLYGDARRADEIVLRNNVPHPGALRGGIALEVLSE